MALRHANGQEASSLVKKAVSALCRVQLKALPTPIPARQVYHYSACSFQLLQAAPRDCSNAQAHQGHTQRLLRVCAPLPSLSLPRWVEEPPPARAQHRKACPTPARATAPARTPETQAPAGCVSAPPKGRRVRSLWPVEDTSQQSPDISRALFRPPPTGPEHGVHREGTGVDSCWGSGVCRGST